MEKVSRIAVYLCVLIVLSEFGPAHFRRLHAQRVKALSKTKHEKRAFAGAVKTLGKYIFKVVEIGAKYFNDVTSIISIISTIYTIVNECKDTEYGAEAQQYTDEAKAITEKINTGSPQIKDLQLETENIQIQVETMNYHFNQTLDEMREAGYLSEKLLEIINPDLTAALINATAELQKELAQAQQGQTPVDYATISKTYATRVDKFVNLAVPIFTTVVPRIPKIIDFGKARVNNIKSFKLTQKFPSKIKLPKINTKPFTAMKSWFAKPKAFLTSAKTALRGKITLTYDKAVKYAKNFAAGFAVLSKLVFGAYNIYTIVTNFGQKKCKETRDRALEALNELKEAEANYDEILKNATAAKEEMIKVKDQLMEQLSDEVFLEDLKNMKENMIQIQGDGSGMQDMIEATDVFINEIPGNQDITQIGALLQNLYEKAMGTLPFVYRCVNDRVQFISYVARECQVGKATLPQVIASAKQLYNYEIEECEQRTGIAYFSDDAIQTMIDKAATTLQFNTECKLNDEFSTKTICSLKCSGKDANKISQELGLSPEGVNEVLSSCPQCEIDDSATKLICALKGANKTPEEIQKIFKQFTLQQITEVAC